MMREILVDANGLVHAYIAMDNAVVLMRDDENCKLFRVCVNHTTFVTLLKQDRDKETSKILPPWACTRTRDLSNTIP